MRLRISNNLQENIIVINFLLNDISKLEKSFRLGKKMLQTVHPYWLSSKKKGIRSKFKDIYGKAINYNIYDYYKPRNKFVNSLINNKYKPPVKKIKQIKSDLQYFKYLFKFYIKNGRPSFDFDFINRKTLIKCTKYFRIPDCPFKNDNFGKDDNELTNEMLKVFQCIFYDSLEREEEKMYSFGDFLERTFQELVSNISFFRKNYIYSYSSILYQLETRMKKRQSFKGHPEINNFLSIIKFFPDLPSDIYCQPPDIKLPNIVSLEEQLMYENKLSA